MDMIFKRLGHLGEVHLVDEGENHTLCGIRSDGPNFSETTPVDLEPRPDPTLCTDCKDALDEREKEEEPEEEEPEEETESEE